jgi:hypothetical protein
MSEIELRYKLEKALQDDGGGIGDFISGLVDMFKITL